MTRSQSILTGNIGDRIVNLETGLTWEIYARGEDREGRPVVEIRGVGFDGDGVVDVDAARDAYWYADADHPVVAEFVKRRAADPTGKFLHYFSDSDSPRHILPPVNYTRHGGVRFLRYAGKPLSAELWEDIVGRLKPRYLHVLRHDQEEKTFRLLGGSDLRIYLDEQNRIWEIAWYP